MIPAFCIYALFVQTRPHTSKKGWWLQNRVWSNKGNRATCVSAQMLTDSIGCVVVCWCVLQEVLHTTSPRQHQPASVEVQLSVAQSELVSSQQQVSTLSSRLAAAEAARAALQEQLDHLGVKVGAWYRRVKMVMGPQAVGTILL